MSSEPREPRFKVARLARLTVVKLAPSLGVGNLALLLVVLVVSAVLPVAVAIATGLLVGSVPAAVERGFDSPAGRILLVALGAVAASYLIQQVLGPFQGAVSETMGRRLDGKLRERVMHAVLRPPGIAHLEDPRLLDEISKARSAGPAGFTPGRGISGLVGVTSRYMQTALFAGILFSFAWWVPILRLTIQLAIRSIGRRELLKMVEIYTGQTEGLRRSQYFFGLGTRPGAAKEVRSFGLRNWLRDRYSDAILPVFEGVWKQRASSVWRFVPLSLTIWPLDLIVYVMMVRAAVEGSIEIGALTTFLIAVRGMAASNWFSDDDFAVEFGMASVPAVLKLEETTAPSRLASGKEDPAAMPREGIRFERVGFRYPGGATQVFEDLDLFIPAGSSLAIVGPNGAGKTTLIKLLCRLYDPDDGHILVDGVDLRDFDARAWQQRVAAIFQDFVRFELSARDNVRFGAIELSDDAHLAEAAKKAGATSVVENLPKGWETILSRRYTDGVDLSGGEWQRIALARALHATAARPGVLVLDEPTANLDVRAEAEIYERFLELTRGLTTILISHRFSTVRGADRICVIDGGRVVEEGTHEELIEVEGRYAKMFKLQAARFLEDDATDEAAVEAQTGSNTTND